MEYRDGKMVIRPEDVFCDGPWRIDYSLKPKKYDPAKDALESPVKRLTADDVIFELDGEVEMASSSNNSSQCKRKKKFLELFKMICF